MQVKFALFVAFLSSAVSAFRLPSTVKLVSRPFGASGFDNNISPNSTVDSNFYPFVYEEKLSTDFLNVEGSVKDSLQKFLLSFSDLEKSKKEELLQFFEAIGIMDLGGAKKIFKKIVSWSGQETELFSISANDKFEESFMSNYLLERYNTVFWGNKLSNLATILMPLAITIGLCPSFKLQGSGTLPVFFLHQNLQLFAA